MALQVSVLQSEDQQTSLYSLVRVWFSKLLIELLRASGIDAYPEVLNLLFTGGNNGKLVLKV